MKIIDLSMAVQPHWRWKLEYSMVREDPWVTGVKTAVHGFTHMDTPLHIERNRITIDQVPLDATVGSALVIDLSYKKANEEITLEDVKPFEDKILENDIVLLKTGWDKDVSYMSKEYWEQAPYVGTEAAEFFLSKKIRAIGFDFPQDYIQRLRKDVAMEEATTHYILLRNGIYMIEYLCNLYSIPADCERVFLCAQPIKYVGAEGSPTRAIAIIDM